MVQATTSVVTPDVAAHAQALGYTITPNNTGFIMRAVGSARGIFMQGLKEVDEALSEISSLRRVVGG